MAVRPGRWTPEPYHQLRALRNASCDRPPSSHSGDHNVWTCLRLTQAPLKRQRLAFLDRCTHRRQDCRNVCGISNASITSIQLFGQRIYRGAPGNSHPDCSSSSHSQAFCQESLLIARERILLEKLEKFASSPWSLVVENREGVLFRSKDDQLIPLMECIESHYPEMVGATVLDKTVGRAAALLCIYAKVDLVLTPLISVAAVEALEESGVLFLALEKVELIVNARGTSPCPMEKKAMGKSPDQFYESLAKKPHHKPVDRANPEC